MQRRHRAWAEIDLAAFRHNLTLAQNIAGSANVWPVLKANAYGHGALALARVCEEMEIECVGVGDSAEALALRTHDINLPLLVLGTVIDAELPLLLEHHVEVGVHSEGRAQELGEQAQTLGEILGVHLKVDVGMGRLGVRPEAALRVARAIERHPFLRLRGVMTHFSAPEGCHDPQTAGQHALFLATVSEIRAAGVAIPHVHCANSAALATGLQPLGDAVRPGIALFGILPDSMEMGKRLKPILSLHAQIVFLKDIPTGAPVGYGSRWTSHRPTRLATLPIGYADGIPYRLGAQGRGTVLVRGQRCPVVGAVSMDYCTVDVGHVPDVQLGDTVTFIGKQGQECLRVQDLAEAAGTIPYEITCSLSGRVHRVLTHVQAPMVSSIR